MDEQSLQIELLRQVSRSFALTIPLLPEGLQTQVGHAYLLCRVADTIEDEPSLAWPVKRELAHAWIRVVSGVESPTEFSSALSSQLGTGTSEAERRLVRLIPEWFSMNQQFDLPLRRVMANCIDVMATGMVEFQAQSGPAGVADLRSLERYCYHVAGVVGELLTELFCLHSVEVAKMRS